MKAIIVEKKVCGTSDSTQSHAVGRSVAVHCRMHRALREQVPSAGALEGNHELRHNVDFFIYQ